MILFRGSYNHLYRPQRSCGQGYVFTHVCDSVHRGVCLSTCWDTASGGSRIFPRGGVNPPGGAWTRQIFLKTAWNRKNLDAQGGCASLTPPLDPPMTATPQEGGTPWPRSPPAKETPQKEAPPRRRSSYQGDPPEGDPQKEAPPTKETPKRRPPKKEAPQKGDPPKRRHPPEGDPQEGGPLPRRPRQEGDPLQAHTQEGNWGGQIPPPPHRHTVNEQLVRIILECILVITGF